MGARTIEQILTLSETADLLRTRLEELNKDLLAMAKEDVEATVSAALRMKIDETRESLRKVESNVVRKTDVLRAVDAASFKTLESMKRSPWINAQLNLRVLRAQLVTKLRARKFELGALDRAHTNRKLGVTPLFVAIFVVS
jgi:hypothetical protein